jgi:predicted GNAT family acetyltransferase
MRENDPPIRDNAAEQRWEITVGDDTAWLTYARGTSVLALIMTSIPAKLSGTGIASRLALHAVQTARAEGLKLDPSCPFMIGWLERHPEYSDLVFVPGGTSAEDPFWF